MPTRSSSGRERSTTNNKLYTLSNIDNTDKE